MLDRELALYAALRPYVKGVTLVSYGDSRDRQYMDRLDGIRLACNRWGVHRRLYARALPYVYPLMWRGPSIAKSNQVPSADVALRVARLAGKKFVEEVRQARGKFPRIHIMLGVEAKFLPSGTVDVSPKILARTDVLGLACHRLPTDLPKYKEAVKEVLKNAAEWAPECDWLHPGLFLQRLP